MSLIKISEGVERGTKWKAVGRAKFRGSSGGGGGGKINRNRVYILFRLYIYMVAMIY